MNHPLSNLRSAPALGFSSAVGLALTVALTGALACNSPSVISSDRAPGAGGGSGAPSGGPGGSGTSGGTAGSSGIALPDAATGQVDVAPAPPMACAEEAYKAEAVPLDLLLLLDSSGSMDGRVGGATKWQLAQTALASFVRDQRSAGLGMGLQYFPNPKRCQGFLDCIATASQCQANDRCIDAAGVSGQLCGGLFGGNCMSGSTCAPTGICSNSFTGCTNIGQPCPMNEGMCESGTAKYCLSNGFAAECDASSYETPVVGIAPLPNNQMPIVRALREKFPNGGTPMRAAVEGSLKQLRAHLEKNPGRKAVLILASDGLPTCTPAAANGIPAIAQLLGAANMGSPAISTYVIGVFAQNEVAMAQPQLDQLAMSGGSGRAFVVTANDDLTMKLQEALDAIRGAALSCEFKIPPPATGSIDYGKVNVRYTGSGGAREDVAYVKTMSNCDPTRGGWYFDVDPAMGTPTRVLVCPSTCTQFKKDGNAKVDLLFGCATRTID